MNEEGRTAHDDPRETAPAGASAGASAGAPAGRGWLLFALLVVVPGLLYGAAAVVPLSPLATGAKLWLVPALVIAAEATFWVAALFLGREIISRYRRFFDPRAWFRKE